MAERARAAEPGGLTATIIPFPAKRAVKPSCGNCWFGVVVRGSPYCARFAEYVTVDHGPDCELWERNE